MNQLTRTRLSRREFIKVGTAGSGGLLLSLSLPGCSQIPPGQKEDSLRPNAWLEISRDGEILFTLDRVEMGQGTMTGLTTLLAEELNVPPESITVVFAPASREYIVEEFGLQITGASSSLRTSWHRIREAGAAGRYLLTAAAAEVWQVSAANLTAEDGKVTNPAKNQSLSYGELASLATRQSLPSSLPLKSPDQFRWIGKAGTRLDAEDKSFGKARYGIDAEPENAVYAVLARPPRLGATLSEVDSSKARQMPGVLDVIATEAGVGVLAESYWQARQARDALDLTWKDGPGSDLSTESVFEQYTRDLDEESGDIVRDDGDLDDAAEAADGWLEAEYRAPYLAHATLEPQNCTAWIRDDRCDVWAPTQGPDIALYVARRASGLSASDIHIHQTLLGGGFGRRLSQDYVTEAVLLARHTDRPVKLVWSREEDTQHDLYRPASLHRLKAAISKEGEALSWEHRIACPRVIDYYAKDAAGALSPSWTPHSMVALGSNFAPLISPDISAFEGADDMPYSIPAIRVEHVISDPGVPVSYWRAVGHSFNGFMVESFVDELAHRAQVDPLEYRLRLLGDHPRHARVLERVAKEADWGKTLPAGRAQGLAVHRSFGTCVAQVAEVSVESGQIRVHKVTCAVDCGVVVNPDIVVAQMESGIIFGLTAALHGEINFEQGRVKESNFHDYPMLRMHESPEIQVSIIESEEEPSGVGEPGLPPIAPAVANALFKLTGKRLRQLPLKAEQLG